MRRKILDWLISASMLSLYFDPFLIRDEEGIGSALMRKERKAGGF